MHASHLSSPHIHNAMSVRAIMLQVLFALIPAIGVYVYFFGWGIVINLMIACITALTTEAMMLKLRARALKPFLTDGSVLVTAFLLALCLPPLVPWWMTMFGVMFAVVFAKHLYGGLGYNPFNPAMIGYAMLLVSFPREMTAWLPPASIADIPVGFFDTLSTIFSSQPPTGMTLDAITMATPLDSLRTQLGLGHTITEAFTQPVFGYFGGRGWEWVNFWFLLGGIWLLLRKIIDWRIPVALLLGLHLTAFTFHILDPDLYASPMFHISSGAVILGAFFIATDPISACTTNKGRLVYGAGIGILTYVIRTWGGYPDGIAFAVLLMNMAAPLIDYYTRPRVFGHELDKD